MPNLRIFPVALEKRANFAGLAAIAVPSLVIGHWSLVIGHSCFVIRQETQKPRER